MSELLLSVAFIFAFVSVVIFVQTSAGLVFQRRDQAARVNRRLAMHSAGLTREQVYARLTRSKIVRFGETVSPALESRLRRALQLAGVTMTVSRFVTTLLAVIGALWLLSFVFWARGAGDALLPNAMVTLLASTGLTIFGAWLWLGWKRRGRVKQIELQMPIALDVMSRALRAGHPVISAIQLAAQEMGDPLGSEFGLVIDETTYGAELQEALNSMAERTGSPDAFYLAVSVAVQTETGGNLAEILEGLAGVIRGRTSLSQKVKALSSEGRTSALLLTALPIFVVCVQLMVHPHTYSDKFSDPLFWPAVGITGVLYLSGWLIIRRIINFKY
jgi:tight adherence protein B